MLGKKLQNRKNKGSALVVALFILAIILISALSITLVAVKERKASIGSAGSNKAYQASETGIESVMQLIMKGNHEYINSGTNSLFSSLASISASCNSSHIIEGAGYKVQFLDKDSNPIDCDDISLPVSDIIKIKSVGESSNSKRAVEALVSNKNTKLLMHFNDINNDGDFNDSSYFYYGYNISNEGSVSVDGTGPILAGTNYAKFSAPGDYVQIEDASSTDDVDFDFSDKDFTIEAWVKFDNLGTYPAIISQGDSSSGNYDGSSFWFYLYDDGGTEKLAFQYYYDNNNDRIIETDWTPDTTNWHHLVFERKGDNGYFFIDGVRQTSSGSFNSTDSIYSSGYPLIVGGWFSEGSFDSTSQFFGDMDEIRITKGVARYTNDFDPWEDVEYVPNI